MQCACDRHQSQCSRVKPKFRILISTLWGKRQKEYGKILEEKAVQSREVKGDFSSPGNISSFSVSGLSQESNYRKVAGFERLGGEGSGWS